MAGSETSNWVKEEDQKKERDKKRKGRRRRVRTTMEKGIEEE